MCQLDQLFQIILDPISCIQWRYSKGLGMLLKTLTQLLTLEKTKALKKRCWNSNLLYAPVFVLKM